MKRDLITERLKLKDIYPERAEALAKEYDLKVDDLELVRKGIIAEKADVDKDERSVTSYINTAAKDRDNEVIEPKGAILTHYRKNPVVPYGHDYRGLPVAKNIWVKKDDKGLLAKTVFLKHAFADEVFHLYTDSVAGTGPAMKAWSIGFIPLKWEESPPEERKPPKEGKGEKDTRIRRTYKKWELLEYSAVMIPSNPEALTQMVEKGLIKSDKLKKDIKEFIEIEGVKTVYEEIEDDWPLIDKICPECGELVMENREDGFTCTSCEWDGEPDLILKRAISKIEETDEYIRIPAKGEEGKHKGHKIRWITVSAKEGIRGIYCIDCKKIITFVFMKDKGWTRAKALKWMADHGKLISEVVERWNEIMPPEKDNDVWEFLEELIELALAGEYTPPDKELEGKIVDGEFIKLKQTTIKGLNKLKEKGYISPQQFEDAILGTVKIDEYDTGTTKIRIRERDLYFNEDGLLDGTGSGCDESGKGEVIELEDGKDQPIDKGVIPFRDTGKADEGAPWNGPKEVREAEVSDLKVMCCWFDSENPDLKGAYKLPHHQASGHKAVWRAAAAAMAVLFGARGGVNVPSSDRRGIYNHLVKTYKLFDKEPPEFREYLPEELVCIDIWVKDTTVYKEAMKINDDKMPSWWDTIRALQEPEQTDREQGIMKELFDRLTEQLNKVEEKLKSLKEGRVLSAKNRKLIQDALAGMEAAVPPLKTLLTATEPPQREEFELEVDKDSKVDNGGKDVKDNPNMVDVDPDKLTGIIQEALKNNIDKIGEEIEKRISKMRGKVG